MENKQLNTTFQIKNLSEDENYGYIEGYASVFDVVDSYKDAVKPGAFTRDLESRKESNDKTIPMLWNHETNNPIGFFSLDEMFEDNHGLYVKGKILLTIPQGKTAYSLLKAGICKKMSIGYMTKKYNIDQATGIRELLDIELYEISLVMFPANKEASILRVKSLDFKEASLNTQDEEIKEDNLNNNSEEEYNTDEFYLLNEPNKKQGLFIKIVDGKPEINVRSVLDFCRKSNLERLALTDEEKARLITKINAVFETIREKTSDLSYISPYEVQQNVIKNFTIKDCERFLKKSGLTNAGFKAFFKRLCELKGVKKEEPIQIVKENSNSLDERENTPEEFNYDFLNSNLKKLQNLLKN